MSRFLILTALVVVPALARVQQPVDALQTCLADNTSGRERKELAKWVFFAMAAHPELKQYTGADAAAAADQSSRTMADIVARLLTDSRMSQVKAVMKTGHGDEAVKLAFKSLGELAMQELMGDKSVQEHGPIRPLHRPNAPQAGADATMKKNQCG
jgi:hypothetical protein